MRLAGTFTMLILGVACSALPPAPVQSLQPEELSGQPDGRAGKPGTIDVISARFGSEFGGACEAPSDDVTLVFKQACDGKWRCRVRVARKLSAEHQAISQAVKVKERRSAQCPSMSARFAVDWTCGQPTARHALTAGPGARLRLSCPRPDERGDHDSVSDPVGSEGPPARPAAVASHAGRDATVHGQYIATAGSVAVSKIVVAGRQVSMDQPGTFHVPRAPANYDLAVVEQDGALISLYLGLSRRDPVLAHSERPAQPRLGFERAAFITGQLKGVRPDGGRNLRSKVIFSPAVPPVRGGDGFEQVYEDSTSFRLNGKRAGSCWIEPVFAWPTRIREVGPTAEPAQGGPFKVLTRRPACAG